MTSIDLTTYVDKMVSDMNVPAGRYVGKILSAEETTTEYGTSIVVAYELTHRLDDADRAEPLSTSRKVVDWLPIRDKDGSAPKAMFRVVETMRGIGIDVRAGGVVQIALNTWVGEQAGLEVGYREYGGKKRQDVRVFPAPATASQVQSAAASIAALPNVPQAPPVAPVAPAPTAATPAAPEAPATAVPPTTDDVMAQLKAQDQG